MMENGELAAKKFGVDWQDCVLQCGGVGGGGKVKLRLKALPALQTLWRTDT